jgi:hypothetical protein
MWVGPGNVPTMTGMRSHPSPALEMIGIHTRCSYRLQHEPRGHLVFMLVTCISKFIALIMVG